jgi:hypothetical protein
METLQMLCTYLKIVIEDRDDFKDAFVNQPRQFIIERMRMNEVPKILRFEPERVPSDQVAETKIPKFFNERRGPFSTMDVIKKFTYSKVEFGSDRY